MVLVQVLLVQVVQVQVVLVQQVLLYLNQLPSWLLLREYSMKWLITDG